MYMIVGLAQSWHWQCPTTISLLPGRKKTVPWLVLMKLPLHWNPETSQALFFFFFLIWISLWLIFVHLLQWSFVEIAVIIKNPLWLSAVHTGAIDSSIKQPSCMSAMIIHTAINCWWREEENSSHFREKLPHVVIGSYFMPGSVLMYHHCYLWGEEK